MSIHSLDLATGVDQRLAYAPTSAAEVRPVLSPDGKLIAFGHQVTDGMEQIMVAPSDASGPGRPLGPKFSYATEHEYGFSPDGTKLVLWFAAKKSILIDVQTGAIQETALSSFIQQWQRRMP